MAMLSAAVTDDSASGQRRLERHDGEQARHEDGCGDETEHGQTPNQLGDEARSAVRRHAPHHIEGVLQHALDADCAPDRDEQGDDEDGAARRDRLHLLPGVGTDERKRGPQGGEDALEQRRTRAQNPVHDGDEDQQRGKQREEPVVRDGSSEPATPIFAVALEDRVREGDDPVTPLEHVDPVSGRVEPHHRNRPNRGRATPSAPACRRSRWLRIARRG